MIIIRMKGGIGNQMFQYALYKQLKASGRNVKMDDVNGFLNDEQRDPALHVFGITYDTATQEEIDDLRDAHLDLGSRIRRKLFGRHSKEYVEPDGVFRPEVLAMEDGYLDGYWQSEKYFPDPSVVRELREEFRADPQQIFAREESFELLQRIRESDSVSIHVRRGDYLWPGVKETFGGICTEGYYQKAMETMLGFDPQAEFFIFTNDKAWCETHMRGENVHTVDTPEDAEDIDLVDMFLMSRCRHHIIANSSYSWWAAWLNESPDKRIIAPAKWLNNKDMSDIYTKEMIRI